MKIFKGLQFKITLACFFMLLLFSIVIIVIIRTSVIKKIENNICDSIYVEHDKIDEGYCILLDTINLLYSPIISTNIIDTLEDDTLDIEEKTSKYIEVINSIPKNDNLFGDIILSLNGQLYHSKTNDQGSYVQYNDFDFIDEVVSQDNISYSKYFFQKGHALDNEGNQYIIFGKPISKYYLPNDECALIYAIKYDGFIDLLTNDNYEVISAFLVSNQEKILFHNDDKYLDSVIFNNDVFNYKDKNYLVENINNAKSLVITSKCQKVSSQYGFDWHIISIVSYDFMFSRINTLNTTLLLVGLTSVLLALLMSYFISAGLVGPVVKLNKRMKEYINNKKQVKGEKIKGDEIVELEKTYDQMIDTITNLIDENNIEQEEKRKLELDALQMQINPHFLYNTLDAIVWIARIKKQEEIEKLVMALAKFFRISLHKGDKFITVEEEIELIENFVAIELIRFPNKFTIEYDVSEEVKKQETMKLIIQPIVENAIKHGVSTLEYEGHIIIRVYCDDLYIYYEIIDNGLGFIPDENLFKGDKTSPSGYGLKNVNERIKLEYGQDCGITVISHLQKGTKVVVKITKR